MTNAIRTRGLTKTFGSFPLSSSIDLDVNTGDISDSSAPTGQEDHTTADLCGLLAPTSGTVEVAGIDANKEASDSRTR